MKLSMKALLPVAVMFGSLLGMVGLIAARPDVSTQHPDRPLPLVEVQVATPRSVELSVEAQGSVVPRTESDLVAEVSGRITWVSPSLAAGGFLEPDEVLVRIDPTDYEVALERSEAALTRATSELRLAHSNLERRRSLSERGVASSAALEDAENVAKVAEANLRDVRAALAQAQRELERTKVTAPFAGRVRAKHVDVGQFVSRGAPVARVYAVDYAEVRLPIPDDDAAFVDLPIEYRDDDESTPGPRVALSASFAGREYTWMGRIVRTEGELDPRTRMIHAVARVEDPYGRSEDPERPPLAVGLFVRAEIAGRVVDDVVELPRAAIRAGDEVAIVGDDGRIELRRVEVLRRTREHALVRSGIAAGERVSVTPLPVTVADMRVGVANEPSP